jgi:hypothetical protein
MAAGSDGCRPLALEHEPRSATSHLLDAPHRAGKVRSMFEIDILIVARTTRIADGGMLVPRAR